MNEEDKNTENNPENIPDKDNNETDTPEGEDSTPDTPESEGSTDTNLPDDKPDDSQGE